METKTVTITAEEIERAKDRLNGWSGEHCICVIADAFLVPDEDLTPERIALQKVIAAGSLDRQWNGWSFFLPSTRDAIKAEPGSLTISGQLYLGQACFEDCPYGDFTLWPGRLRHREYIQEVSRNELGRDFLRALDWLVLNPEPPKR